MYKERKIRMRGDKLQISPQERTEPKIHRNDPCRCGSGKKNKKCCDTK